MVTNLEHCRDQFVGRDRPAKDDLHPLSILGPPAAIEECVLLHLCEAVLTPWGIILADTVKVLGDRSVTRQELCLVERDVSMGPIQPKLDLGDQSVRPPAFVPVVPFSLPPAQYFCPAVVPVGSYFPLPVQLLLVPLWTAIQFGNPGDDHNCGCGAVSNTWQSAALFSRAAFHLALAARLAATGRGSRAFSGRCTSRTGDR